MNSYKSFQVCDQCPKKKDVGSGPSRKVGLAGRFRVNLGATFSYTDSERQ